MFQPYPDTSPDYVVIGHVAKDLVPGGFRIGGTVTYAAVTARNLGRRVGVVTSVAPDFPLGEALSGVDLCVIPAETTTTFENIYHHGARTQFIHARATPITPAHVPPSWRNAPIVHLGPIAQEVEEDLCALFPQALVGVTPQGWMRWWDGDGRIEPLTWEGFPRLVARGMARQGRPATRVVVLSVEDVAGDLSVVQRWAEVIDIVVVTTGPGGATVYCRGESRHFPARPTTEVDPTGAGDVFAAAYLIRLDETGDPWEAARFANVVASFSIEKPGIDGIPSRGQVEAWLATHGE